MGGGAWEALVGSRAAPCAPVVTPHVQPFCFFSGARTHARSHARARARADTHTHAHTAHVQGEYWHSCDGRRFTRTYSTLRIHSTARRSCHVPSLRLAVRTRSMSSTCLVPLERASVSTAAVVTDLRGSWRDTTANSVKVQVAVGSVCSVSAVCTPRTRVDTCPHGNSPTR